MVNLYSEDPVAIHNANELCDHPKLAISKQQIKEQNKYIILFSSGFGAGFALSCILLFCLFRRPKREASDRNSTDPKPESVMYYENESRYPNESPYPMKGKKSPVTSPRDGAF